MGRMYITLMPVILAGVCNMVFVKTSLYKNHCKPIDNERCLADGKRILGENKTWIGFLSMIAFTILFQILWGVICKAVGWENIHEIYQVKENIPIYNIVFGFFFGFAYVICELPNSFVKRRFDIPPGKSKFTKIGVFFFVLDQFDSIFGVILVLAFLVNLSVERYFAYVALGGVTHLVVNIILYISKMRKNI